MISQEPIFLDCPFAEKDAVKLLGAKFDWQEKKWFIPPGLDTESFQKWLPQSLVPPPDETAVESLSLNEFLLTVQQTISQHHSSRYWVRAEVLSISGHSHLYLELVDYDANGSEIAKVRATLWQQRAHVLLEQFATQTGLTFAAGIKVLLQVRVEFHTRYGLSLDVLAIDPNFTLGEMAAKLNRIRQQLITDGIYQRNQTLAHPKEFCRVAVVAPPQAAGLGDFQSQAKLLATADLCQFHYYTASFQGQYAMTEIPAALQSVAKDHEKQSYDAVVLIRGGGAKADLFQLNEYEIVKAVCMTPLPVIVGIGHERDQTLLDEVAHLSCHTPSLVIAYLTSTIVQNARQALQHWQQIVALAKEQLSQAQRLNEQRYAQIRELAVKRLEEQRHQLAILMQAIDHSNHQQLTQARHQCKSLIEQILLGDPKRILERGYAIVRNEKNKLITSKRMAQRQKKLVIEFKDGRFNC
jgi:exodeoxyribonuclease VII large subunit